jgi:4-hydroxy-L-threonine phosphate dehydrogenase PdxA
MGEVLEAMRAKGSWRGTFKNRRKDGAIIDGPLPADTAFVPASIKAHDGFVAMYHDQGLIPFKMLAFDVGVNVTLGLPMVRTSADHGTAWAIGETGQTAKAAALDPTWLDRTYHDMVAMGGAGRN